MSSRTIPAKLIVTCDSCLRTCGAGAPWNERATMRLETRPPDNSGTRWSKTRNYDLCDDCNIRIRNAIRVQIDALREEIREEIKGKSDEF